MIREKIHIFWKTEFLRFVIVGILATAIQYLFYYLLLRWLSPTVAFTVGYILSFVFNFIMTSRFTFRAKATVKRGVGFGLSHFVNYLLQIGVLNLSLYLGIPPKLSPLPVYAICIPVNFLLVRFVFKKQ